MRNNFAIFILTHGRPDAQHTLKTLLDKGYKGKWYLVLDDQDDTIQEYIDNYSASNILVFDKNYYINHSEVGTNNPSSKCVLYAKNAVENMAREMGLSSFVLADDDIQYLYFRWSDGEKCRARKVDDIDSIIDGYVDLIESCDIAATGFGFSQFYFGGKDSFNYDNFQKLRVPYNFVFRKTKYKVDWVSSFGEDIITAIQYNKIGQVWLATPYIQQEIVPLASAKGGMFETYNSNDSFVLAMYDFMYHPTSTKPYYYKDKWMASIKREFAFPKLISSKYKKEEK